MSELTYLLQENYIYTSFILFNKKGVFKTHTKNLIQTIENLF